MHTLSCILCKEQEVLVLGLVMEYLGKSEKAIVYSLQQMDFFLQYSLTDTPLLHARHRAVIAWQQMRGTIGTHFPQQFPLLGSAFNNLSPRLHIGFMHITVAQIFGFGGRTGTHTNTGGQRAGDRSFPDNKALRAFALTLPPFTAFTPLP